MLVVNRFVVDGTDGDVTEFTAAAHRALAVLAAQRGFRDGELARSLDEPDHWLLVTRWESVGAYRRALGAFEVKTEATPLLARSLDEPSAYEVLAAADTDGGMVTNASDRAVDGDHAMPRGTLRSGT